MRCYNFLGGNILASPLKPPELTPKAQLRSVNQSQFSQFFTSPEIAQFMAGLFTPNLTETCHLLDAGAGVGYLSAAFLNHAHRLDLNRIELDAFEIDPSLHSQLTKTLVSYQTSLNFKVKLYPQDFIHAASDWLSGNLFAQPLPRYHYAILNPPYQKIHSHSPHRKALRQVGIETVNLYSAFIALSLLLLADRGDNWWRSPLAVFAMALTIDRFVNFYLNRQLSARFIYLNPVARSLKTIMSYKKT